MDLLTRHSMAQIASQRWDQQYNRSVDSHKIAIGARLRNLSLPVDPDVVDLIVGNTSWTSIGICHECRKEPDALIQIGETQDYDSSTANVCLDCIRRAAEMLEQSHATQETP